MPVNLPNLGSFEADSGMITLAASTDGSFKTGQDGVTNILATGDRKVEFIGFRDRTLAYVRSAMGYPAYYMVQPVALKKPVKAILMDLDGTSVRSEHFWIWIIEKTTASLLKNPSFQLEESDVPHVSGHSVSEHLQYCIKKYCPGKTVEEAVEDACILEELARMALDTLALAPNRPPIPQYLLDKHFLRKHGPGAYYGQK